MGSEHLPAVSFVDIEYLVRDGAALLARVYRPSGSNTKLPAVIDVHGGHWSHGDRTAGELYDRSLAQSGFVVVAVDFRQAPDFAHPCASDDVASAVRWVRRSADELGVDPRKVGLVGSSSGGHLALLAACQNWSPGHTAAPTELEGPVSCVAALWSPVDPHGRFRFAQQQIERVHADQQAHYETLLAGSLNYFESEAAMAEASITRIVTTETPPTLPPLLLVHPTEDMNVPRSILDELQGAWQRAGGQVELKVYEGQLHGFGHRPGPATDTFLADLAEFLARHLQSPRIP